MRQVGLKESELIYPAEERRHEESKSSATYHSYMSASTDYGKLLVANLIIINAGALLVFPTLLDKVGIGQLNAQSVASAMTWFVFGLLGALVAGYAAYLNFMWLANHTAVLTNRKIFVNKCTAEMLALEGNKEIIADFDSQSDRFGRLIRWSFYIGNAVGIFSLCCFVVGCFSVRTEVISRHAGAISSSLDFIHQQASELFHLFQ